MWPTWTPAFSSWPLVWQVAAWSALAAVPAAIVLLYFLKLKRQPLEVPSTYLWLKSIEDLHVNSLWQRLRQSLLLWLQLLLVLLAILALLRPSWASSRVLGDRLVFLIDASASMAASDVAPSRLEEAKRLALEQIEQMEGDAVGMVVSFSDVARIEQQFTSNRKLLRRAVENIRQTSRGTDMKEALQVAAGLANPGRSASDVTDVQVADPLPAELKIYSDGGLERVPDFSLGNLEPEFIQLGQAVYQPSPEPAGGREALSWAENVGITAFAARRKEGKVAELEAFARLENFGPEDATVETELLLDGVLVDARRVEIPAGDSQGVPFDLGEVASGGLELRVKTGDALKLDDVAWTTINPPRRASVLLVTPGNEPLEFALGTERAVALANVVRQAPGFLETEDYRRQVVARTYDLVIYDRCQPKEMPLANTLFIGALPLEGWSAEPVKNVPQIIDIDRSHPLMQLIESMGDVIIAEGTPLVPPKGSTVLIDTHVGPMLAIAPRESFEDAVLGFTIMDEETIGTNWPLRPSFPVVVLNVLQYLGGVREGADDGGVRPGQAVELASDKPAEALTVKTPQGRSVRVQRGNLSSYNFVDTHELGIYEVLRDGEPIRRFAVNLFNPVESNIKPKDIQIGHTELQGKRAVEPARRDLWWHLLVGALAVLLCEWYIYNRRVYL